MAAESPAQLMVTHIFRWTPVVCGMCAFSPEGAAQANGLGEGGLPAEVRKPCKGAIDPPIKLKRPSARVLR
jgi:hypothetical protein